MSDPLLYQRDPDLLMEWASDEEDPAGHPVLLTDARSGRRCPRPDPSGDPELTLRVLSRLGAPTTAEELHRRWPDARQLARLQAVLEAAELAGLVTVSAARDSPHDHPGGCSPHQSAAHREASMVPPDIDSLPGTPPPARLPAPATPETVTRLPDPPAPAPTHPFETVLAQRRSLREFTSEPVPLHLLGTLLGRAARVRGHLSPLEHQQTQRPSPSGGGRHSLEIYVLARSVDGLEPGVHHYDPFGHTLERRGGWDAHLEELVDRLVTVPGRMDQAPPVSLYFASHVTRTSWKYGGMTLSLVYRDTGCLMQTLCLTAADLGLGACPIGALEAPVTAPFLAGSGSEVMHVGGMALGAPAGPAPAVVPHPGAHDEGGPSSVTAV
ncbi:SagB/ThcOx family dehydrogenase [Streptomyces sp. NBC_00356]|uniref:SagB/ThcOx family dehydrogenase n=1 Tax=Streptomyces sp. NBC_00356 TaxID=2975724 RepID=UPI002E273E2C